MKNSCLFLILLISLNSLAMLGQEKKIMKPKYMGEETQDKVPPNTIKFKGKLVGKFKQGEDCSKTRTNFIEVEVESIISIGSSIVNYLMPNKKFCFMVNEALKKRLKKVEASVDLEFMITEQLCMGGNKTVYTVLNFTEKK